MEQNTANLPRHIAIIPDGNRRWARAQGKKSSEGHAVGAANLEKLISRLARGKIRGEGDNR